MSSSYLGLLGLARRAGKVEMGDDAAKAACTAGAARLIIISSEASSRTRETFRFIAENANIPHITVSETREEIGNALGKRPIVVCALCDTGFAAAIIKKLADANEDAKNALPEAVRKAERVASRAKKKHK